MQHKPNNQQRLPTLEVKRIFGKFWTRKGLDRLSIFSQGVPYLTEEVEASSWHSMYLLPGRYECALSNPRMNSAASSAFFSAYSIPTVCPFTTGNLLFYAPLRTGLAFGS